MNVRVLDGVRVVELAQGVAGPYCGCLLASLGAEVIKVEPPGAGDESRRHGPFVGGQSDLETSGQFLWVNRGKKSVTLDVRSPDGAALLRRLVLASDVFVEDLTPGDADALGCGWEDLRREKPGLVMVSVTPFGQTGPHARYKAHPFNTVHAGGHGWLLACDAEFVDRPPIQTAGYIAEIDAGIAGAGAAVAALVTRNRDGAGRHVDVSKQEVGVFINRLEEARYHREHFVEGRDNRPERPGGTIRVSDGWIQMRPTGEDWTVLVHAMGDPDWARDPRFQTDPDRLKHAHEINAHVNEWAKSFTRRELVMLLQSFDLRAAAVEDAREILEGAQLKHRGFFQTTDRAKAGPLQYPGLPFHAAALPTDAPRPAPFLGQHSEEVYGGVLGLGAADIRRLRKNHVI